MRRMHDVVIGLLGLIVSAGGASGRAADWPMWRGDAARSGTSAESLPAELHLQWVRQLPAPQPAWPDEPRSAFDWTYEPIVMGRLLLLPSSAEDGLIALDTETGQERWRYFAQGPVRFPAAGWQDRVFFVSDDGDLVCLESASGKLLWKCRGGPDERRVLGNGRLISAWPARGGPVVVDGKVYFAAGIWPSLGIFLHAVDATTGRILWTNDSSGAVWTEQPHGGGAPNGPAPQGCLAVSGDRLLVPNGRTYPAVFDLRDGRLLAYQMGHRDEVGCQVVAGDRYFFAGPCCGFGDGDGDSFEVLLRGGYRLPVVSQGVLFHSYLSRHDPAAGDAPEPNPQSCFPVASPLPRGTRAFEQVVPPMFLYTEAQELAGGRRTAAAGDAKPAQFAFPTRWRLPGFQVLIKAGTRLYGTSGSDVAAVDLPVGGAVPHITWRASVDGQPLTMAAAGGRLFVVAHAREGDDVRVNLSCFGGQPGAPITHRRTTRPLDTSANRWTTAVQQMLEVVTKNVHAEPLLGYALVLGVTDGQLAETLLRESQLQVIVIDPDEQKLQTLRRRWQAAGEYGGRIAAVVADPLRLPLPPYLARLVTSENVLSAGFGRGLDFVRPGFEVLRPFGGTACWPLTDAQERQFANWVEQLQLPGAAVGRVGDFVFLKREGPLPRSANWTHEFADAANTRMSPDELVAGPLGVLWFGGPLRNRWLYPKTLVPPAPPIVDGRMFVQGPAAIRAVDIYTGTILWTHPFEDDKENRSLTFEKGDFRVTYRPPDGSSQDYAKLKRVGYNCVAVPDALYVACGQACLRLDPATGQVQSRIVAAADDGQPCYWDNLRVDADLLVATVIAPNVSTPTGGYSREELGGARQEFRESEWIRNLETIPANYVVAVDRRTEKVLWRHKAQQAFLGGQTIWHLWGSQSYQDSSLAVGGGKVFCLDMLPGDVSAILRRRGWEPSAAARLIALDLRSGQVLWQQPTERFCSLAYSQEHDVLVAAEAKQASPRTQGFMGDESTARRGSDGAQLWKGGGVEGPVILHHGTVYLNGSALDLLTGAEKHTKHPLTEESIAWRFPRGYGCGVPIGGEHLLTFRSGTAAYCDLAGDSGTVHFGGVRTGCSSPFLPAGGILNGPNYALGCTCNYQLDTSLALVHMPDAEAWGWLTLPRSAEPIRRLGLNFNAPGARRAEDGTLWIACPDRLDRPVQVQVAADPLEKFRWHPSRVAGEGPQWVAASGIDGVRKITIELCPTEGAPMLYTVSLHLVEPQAAAVGDRVFDIAVQGSVVASDFDIIRQAGGVQRSVVRRWTGIPVRRELEITFTGHPGVKLPYAAVCGIEVSREPGP